MIMNNILSLIKKSNTIGITFHTSPDGDSLGSSLGLLQALRRLNKNAYIICKEEIENTFSFLPYSTEINGNVSTVKEGTDLVIVLDCGNFERVNAILDMKNKNYTLINVDHHISNGLYGDLNFVDTNSSCMAEIVYQMLRSLGVEIDQDIAKCLYTSILTDTGAFRYSNTTSVTHAIAGDLVNTGIDFSAIHRIIFDNKEFVRFKLYGEVFNKMELINSSICFMEVTQEMFEKYNIDPGTDTSDVVSFGNQIEGVEVTVLFKEKQNEVKLSIRSKSKVDVRKIAENFGGGGHIRAAGAVIKGKSLKEAKEEILKIIQKELI
ncbi:phosphoesterase RecJ-like protein [Clostridium pascui]|uniref:DHH family phosphoesterase n=1 Tax=Clostridium pascui TaxID=46609 RepID=UPI00195D0BA2|nr:bifunctional oligoribonuclease/PAP phosphatase NrnA [Clostridium pascui]MBM7868987.1 phosphoesterase RecJ-like protein [Clostridium pascui]